MEAKEATRCSRIWTQAEANVRKINAKAKTYTITVKAQAKTSTKINLSFTDKIIEYTKANR